MTFRTRRLILNAVAVVCGLVTGVLVVSRPMAPEQPPTQALAPELGSGIRVTTKVVTPHPSESWMLMAPAELGEERPPDTVNDCAKLFDWAMTRGAALTSATRHLIEIHADDLTVLEHVSASAVWKTDDTPSPRSAKPPVRLYCQPDAKTEPTWPNTSGAPEILIENGEPESQFLPVPAALGPDNPISTEVVVQPMYGSTGPYDYAITVQLQLADSAKIEPVRLTGQNLRASEDGTGMGYSPARYEWTMAPTPSRRYCPELRDPGTGPAPTRRCVPA